MEDKAIHCQQYLLEAAYQGTDLVGARAVPTRHHQWSTTSDLTPNRRAKTDYTPYIEIRDCGTVNRHAGLVFGATLGVAALPAYQTFNVYST